MKKGNAESNVSTVSHLKIFYYILQLGTTRQWKSNKIYKSNLDDQKVPCTPTILKSINRNISGSVFSFFYICLTELISEPRWIFNFDPVHNQIKCRVNRVLGLGGNDEKWVMFFSWLGSSNEMWEMVEEGSSQIKFFPRKIYAN